MKGRNFNGSLQRVPSRRTGRGEGAGGRAASPAFRRAGSPGRQASRPRPRAPALRPSASAPALRASRPSLGASRAGLFARQSGSGTSRARPGALAARLFGSCARLFTLRAKLGTLCANFLGRVQSFLPCAKRALCATFLGACKLFLRAKLRSLVRKPFWVACKAFCLARKAQSLAAEPRSLVSTAFDLAHEAPVLRGRRAGLRARVGMGSARRSRPGSNPPKGRTLPAGSRPRAAPGVEHGTSATHTGWRKFVDEGERTEGPPNYLKPVRLAATRWKNQIAAEERHLAHAGIKPTGEGQRTGKARNPAQAASTTPTNTSWPASIPMLKEKSAKLDIALREPNLCECSGKAEAVQQAKESRR